jgi:hypothetical protein
MGLNTVVIMSLFMLLLSGWLCHSSKLTLPDMLADSLTKAAPHSSLKKLQEKCLKVLSPTTKEGC